MKSFQQSIDDGAVLLFDGATGTSFQSRDLTAEDFGGSELEGCNENLCRTARTIVEEVHDEFLEAGADVIETNSFGATSIVLDEYDLGADAYELSRLSAEIARGRADAFSTSDRPRYVAGSVGPSTKLPSLGHLGFDEMVASYAEHIGGLIDGGIDLLAIETCQDPLQAKVGLEAARLAFEERDVRLPIIVSVTIEMTGTMLMGTEIAAALTILEPYESVSLIGLNCATGPQEMQEHLRYLAAHSPKPIFVMPNAGIPENIGGHPHYHLTPQELADWAERLVGELGVSVLGGCCGTTPEHIAAVRSVIDRCDRAERSPEYEPSASSIFSAVPLRLEPAPLLVGERCNANGSRKFKRLLAADDYEAMVAMAREQVREGAHFLDVCVAYVGRDEMADMIEVVERFNRLVELPLVIDSTETPVIEAALKRYAGRAVINSINFEDGTDRAQQVVDLARRFGAALIALSIDEEGQAYTTERKVSIAQRIRDFVVEENGMRESDLIFDPLTFTLGTGQEELRSSGTETIDAIRQIKERMPDSHTILGLSNCSFGLNPAARQTLNSVFLYHAVEAGLDMSIVHASKIEPLNRLDEDGARFAADLIYDRRAFDDPAESADSGVETASVS